MARKGKFFILFISFIGILISAHQVKADNLSSTSVPNGDIIELQGDFNTDIWQPVCEGYTPPYAFHPRYLEVLYNIIIRDSNFNDVAIYPAGSSWYLPIGEPAPGSDIGCGGNFAGGYYVYRWDSNVARIQIQNLTPGQTYQVFADGRQITDVEESDIDANTPGPQPLSDTGDYYVHKIGEFTVPTPTATATATVTSNLPTSWIVMDPGNSAHPGSGTASPTGGYTGPVGTWSIQVDNLTCYSKTVSPTSQSIGGGETKNFDITYISDGSCGGSGAVPDPDLQFNGQQRNATITQGQTGTLTWTVGGGAADSCSATSTPSNGNWSGPKSVTGGSETSGAVNSQTTFLIQCTNAYGTGQSQVIVTIQGQAPVPGCTEPTANNYNPSATQDDGSCTYTPNNNIPYGALDPSNCTMNGWGYDQDTPNTSTTIKVYDENSNEVDSFSASNYRGDLQAAGLGNGNHGFIRAAPSGVYNGTHTLYFYVLDTANNQPAPFGSYSYNFASCVDNSPIGVVDSSNSTNPPIENCSTFAGWAYDPDKSSTSIDVKVKDAVTGADIGTLTANGSRPDVNAILGITGNHGYTGNTPASFKDGALHHAYVYALNINSSGTANSALDAYIGDFRVKCPLPTVTLTSNPDAVAYNGASTLTWTPANADTCTAGGDNPNGNWTSSKTDTDGSHSEGTGNLTPASGATYNYSITCTNAYGSANAVTSVQVAAPLVPTVDIKADDQNSLTVDYYDSATISWTSSNTDSCSISPGGWTGTSGSGYETGPLTQSQYTYTATCTGAANQQATDLVTITVNNAPTPTCSLSVDNSSLAWNNTGTTLRWTSNGNPLTTALNASGNWSGSKTPLASGSEGTGHLEPGNYSYTLTGVGPGGNTTCGSGAVSVSVTAPTPTASNISATQPNYCVTGPAATIGWTYSDASGSPQTKYQVQITNTGSFTNPIIDSGVVTSSGTSFYSGPLQFNVTYKARVMVWNTYNNPSAWETMSGNFKTPSYAYPQVGMSWTPKKPPKNTPVQFTDRTVFGGGNTNSRNWAWTFGDGGTSSSQNPTHTYTTENSFLLTLTVTDAAGQTCGTTGYGTIQGLDPAICNANCGINVQKPIPSIKEVAPK